MFGSIDGSSGGGKDADCSCIVAASGIAKLLLASESFLWLLLLQHILEFAAFGARLLKNFDDVLELGLKIAGNMVAGEILSGLLAAEKAKKGNT